MGWLTLVVAELGSDEDDIDEEGQEYLEMLAKQAGEDGDDEDWEEDDAEETALEGYTTTVDDEDNFVDEYQIFKAILQSTIISDLWFIPADPSMLNVLSQVTLLLRRYSDPWPSMVPGTNTGPRWGTEETPSGHWNTCRPETGGTWWVPAETVLTWISHATWTHIQQHLLWLQNPRWLRNTAATSSQRRWCRLVSTLEAVLLEWIESSVLLFITLWLIVVKWKKKACVVPLSSGSRTGFSQSFQSVWWGKIAPEVAGKQPKCNQWLGTWVSCKRRSSERCFLEPRKRIPGCQL